MKNRGDEACFVAGARLDLVQIEESDINRTGHRAQNSYPPSPNSLRVLRVLRGSRSGFAAVPDTGCQVKLGLLQVC